MAVAPARQSVVPQKKTKEERMYFFPKIWRGIVKSGEIAANMGDKRDIRFAKRFEKQIFYRAGRKIARGSERIIRIHADIFWV
jgi:hypothetical protein